MTTRKDQRYYGKFAQDFPDHPKILPLSDAAFRCLVEATLWSCKQKTDGVLARRLAVARWSLEVLRELSTNDDANPSLIECETGWLIRDFAEHQTTKAEIEARSERNKAAGRRGGLARAKRSAKRSAKRTASEVVSEVVSETQAEVEVEVETLGTYVPSEGRTTAQRGTSIPADWTPTPDVVAQMRSDHPHVDLKAEHAKFIDYWCAQPGAKGRKSDWQATYRNWIRRAAEQRAPRTAAPPNGQQGASTVDRKVAGWLEMDVRKPQPPRMELE
jgi:hypothetical protein